jgi:hypothetical protein
MLRKTDGHASGDESSLGLDTGDLAGADALAKAARPPMQNGVAFTWSGRRDQPKEAVD